LTSRLGGHPPPTDTPTRHLISHGLPAQTSNHDSPGWGPSPQGVRQERATLPQYHAPRRYTSSSRQEPVRAPRGKDHGKPLVAPVGGEGSRGNTLLPSARGPMGFDSPGQLTTPSDPDLHHQHQHLPTGMPHGRKFPFRWCSIRKLCILIYSISCQHYWLWHFKYYPIPIIITIY